MSIEKVNEAMARIEDLDLDPRRTMVLQSTVSSMFFLQGLSKEMGVLVEDITADMVIDSYVEYDNERDGY